LTIRKRALEVATKANKSLVTVRGNEEKVALHPGDQGKERFYRTGRQVIAHCELGISVETWFDEFQSLVAESEKWMAERSDRVRACFCSPSMTHIVLFVVPSLDSFDFELADELTELNISLLNKFNIGNLEVHQIPWVEKERFVGFNSARLIYERPQSPPTPMGT